MKQVYSNLEYQKGLHTGGLVSLQVTPREWLASDPLIDFDSGRVLTVIALKADKFWLSMQLTQGSYDYLEDPKVSKSGVSYEVSAGGLLNTSNYQFQQVLETIRMHELVCVLTDRNKRRKLIGDTTTGLKLLVTHSNKNNPGLQKTTLAMTCECESRPPYYNPDNTPDGVGNFLINSTGDFLLIG